MLGRLQAQPRGIPWFDFALTGIMLAGLVCYPELIPWVMFHC
jgi:hypothetical protein